MAKKQIKKYVFEPGISKDSNLYPKAVALLLANKAFLQAQVVAFINYNITNNIAPYVGYTFASAKCTRDVGYFIDAVAHDLRYGGNVNSRQIAEYFWIDGEPMIRGDVSRNYRPGLSSQRYQRLYLYQYHSDSQLRQCQCADQIHRSECRSRSQFKKHQSLEYL